MKLKFFNTLTRKKNEFQPKNPPNVSLYTCGPTVYASPTIGNWRTYIFEDVLRRTLEYFGYQVNHLMNLTDVGHLTSDADLGEDKLDLAATKEKVTAWEIAKKYEAEFKQGLEQLNINFPTKFSRATDYIKEQINLIKTLEAKGFTYKTADGIYFNTVKFPTYGQLARLDIKGLKEGARVEKNREKQNPTDFALWKFSPQGQKRDMEWDSPWGVGFPGWHLECSAMILAELGPTIDIHCGGVDLIPIHHTNEIAQSEAATGKSPFVKYWLHADFLLIDSGRMGKSVGNAYTLDDVLEKGYNPLDLRFFYYGAHYRSKQNFTWEALEGAKNRLNKIRSTIFYLRKSTDKDIPLKEELDDRAKKVLEKFERAIADDLNLPQALAVFNSVVNLIEYNWEKKEVSFIGDRPNDLTMALLEEEQTLSVIREMDKIFGLKLLDEDLTIPAEILKLQQDRELARQASDWVRADKLRSQIEQEGYLVIDEKESSKVIKVEGQISKS